MDLQTPCNACTLINRKPASPKLSFSRNNIRMRKYRCKTVSELQSTASVNGGASPSPVPSHKITVHDRQRDVVHEFYVPEDQYILHTAEDQDIKLPFACRHGCCTSCAVRIKSGELIQPEALGISAELKSKGYALLCVGFPSSDLEVETQDEDEVYWLQFGRYFARGPIERDDYALELAMGDEIFIHELRMALYCSISCRAHKICNREAMSFLVYDCSVNYTL
ncbi:hypothetical protein SASPL_112691 [Salvia splendens]|uniref:2Fe-2S ferredoxin-type domain-containing protein n=2 Tax=Salvia splendens TaxID=180675 RepID=A0A8X8YAK8_SALSN|nr:hypothetical protein SASPL_112691 [Salvia splendens]